MDYQNRVHFTVVEWKQNNSSHMQMRHRQEDNTFTRTQLGKEKTNKKSHKSAPLCKVEECSFCRSFLIDPRAHCDRHFDLRFWKWSLLNVESFVTAEVDCTWIVGLSISQHASMISRHGPNECSFMENGPRERNVELPAVVTRWFKKYSPSLIRRLLK